MDDQRQNPAPPQGGQNAGSLTGTDIPSQVADLPVTSIPSQDQPTTPIPPQPAPTSAPVPTFPPQPTRPVQPPQPPQQPPQEETPPPPPKKWPSLPLTMLLILLVLTLTGLSFYLVVQLTNKESSQDNRSKAAEHIVITPASFYSEPATNPNKFTQETILTVAGEKISGKTFSDVANTLFPNRNISGSPEDMDAVTNYFIDRSILKNEAQKRGITVTAKEIQEKIDYWLKYSPAGTQTTRTSSLWQEFAETSLLGNKIEKVIEKETGLTLVQWLGQKIETISVVKNY